MSVLNAAVNEKQGFGQGCNILKSYRGCFGFSAQKKGKISSIPSGSLCKGLNYVLDCTDNKYFQMCVSGRNNFIYYKMTTCGMEVGEGHVGGCEQSKGEEMEK